MPRDAAELRALFHQVRDQGKLLSGQHHYHQHDEMSHVQTLTGKRPAVLGFDFLSFHVQPTWWPMYRELALEHHRAGGVVQISWHETSPSLSVLDEGGYPNGTLFDMDQATFDQVLEPGTALHDSWRTHVAICAGWLRELQDFGVPVMWRPYHEMTGKWFWWGAKEPAGFRRLWRNLHHELTHVHGLQNLVWCWSGAHVDPGYGPYIDPETTDLVGVDLYEQTRDSSVYAERAKHIAEATNLPFGYAELGLLPELDTLFAVQATWVLVWGSTFLDKERWPSDHPGNTPGAIRELYGDPRVLSLGDF